jgi:tripartite-type tricarboxylate transporter receptor subunit TctC
VLAGPHPDGFVSAGSAVQQWKGGKLKMIAVGGKKRMPQLPDIRPSPRPCRAMRRCRGSGCSAGRHAAETVAKINKEVRALFADPEFQKTFLDRFCSSRSRARPRTDDFVKSEEPKWRKIIQDAKIKVE